MLTRNGYIAPPARRRRQQHHDYTDHYHKSSWLDDSLMFNPGHRDDTNDSRLFLLTVLVTSHQPAPVAVPAAGSESSGCCHGHAGPVTVLRVTHCDSD